MKKLSMLIAVVTASVGFMMMPTTARADSANAATITNDVGCSFFGGFTFDSHSVVTSNGNGVLKCKGNAAPPASGHAERASGFLCGTFAGVTTDSMQITSASGEVMLTCIVH